MPTNWSAVKFLHNFFPAGKMMVQSIYSDQNKTVLHFDKQQVLFINNIFNEWIITYVIQTNNSKIKP